MNKKIILLTLIAINTQTTIANSQRYNRIKLSPRSLTACAISGLFLGYSIGLFIQQIMNPEF